MERDALLDEKKRKVDEDKEKAVELRQQSLETFAQTKKRIDDSGHGGEPSKRNKRSDIMNYLKEKKEEENALKERELNIREVGSRNVSEQQQQMQNMFNALIQQQQQKK